MNSVSGYVSIVPALVQAVAGEHVRVDGLRLRIPGTVKIRASVLAGNVRMRTILNRVVHAGDTVVDVGANIGAIAVYAAARVGPSGQVVALEPARDNLAVLRENVATNGLTNVRVVDAAAGRTREIRQFYQRGDVSAVNSLFPDSCYGEVTSTSTVDVIPLDEVVGSRVALVKIDVEGAELDVLAGMPRLLAQPGLTLVAEWHPELQRAAGYAPDALPNALLDAGFAVTAVGHLRASRLNRSDIPGLMAMLLERHSPVELLCTRA